MTLCCQAPADDCSCVTSSADVQPTAADYRRRVIPNLYQFEIHLLVEAALVDRPICRGFFLVQLIRPTSCSRAQRPNIGWGLVQRFWQAQVLFSAALYFTV